MTKGEMNAFDNPDQAVVAKILRLLAEEGLSPMEAVRAMTAGAAVLISGEVPADKKQK
jgi:hypothetical protein